VVLPLYHATEPVGEWPVTLAVQTVGLPAVIEMGLQVTTVFVAIAMTPSENVPELPTLLESPG
jgi:hypothetical protein